MNHLSYPLQSDSSAGEQLCCREGGEMVIWGRKRGGGENEEEGAGEGGVEQAVRGNEKWLNSGSPSVQC